MMLKRNIKIILIGLFSLLFVGLIYGLFNMKPEIISDERLRVEEPPMPGLQSKVERVASTDIKPISGASAEIKSILEDKLIERPVASYREDIVSQVPQVDLPIEPIQQSAEPEVSSGSTLSTSITKELSENDEGLQHNRVPVEQLKNARSSSVSPFKDNVGVAVAESSKQNTSDHDGFVVFEELADKQGQFEASEPVEEALSPQENVVKIVPESPAFLDLNLADIKPAQSEIKLSEADQLVVGNINQNMSEFQPGISDEAKIEKVAKESVGSVTLNPQGDLESQQSEGSHEMATIMPLKKQSVFTMPDIDESLMEGDSEISRQYRQTMSKLISINAKLRDADEENAELKTQFDTVVSQNRQLAQIIRDINSQIEAYTLTN